MLKKPCPTYIIGVVLLVLVLGAGWYALVRQNGQKVAEEKAENGDELEVEAPMVGVEKKSKKPADIPANWQEYRNEEYGFGFWYPSSWGEVFIDHITGRPTIDLPSGIGYLYIAKVAESQKESYFTRYEEIAENNFGVKFYQMDFSGRGGNYLINAFYTLTGEAVQITLNVGREADPSGKRLPSGYISDRNAWYTEHIPEYKDFQKLLDSVHFLDFRG